jgi:hypothetical protein
MFRVIDFVARHHSSVFAAPADLLDEDFTFLAFIVMASLGALVTLTWEELLASALADRDFVGALSSFLTKKSYDFTTSAWAIFNSRGSFLTRRAWSFVTYFLASVLPTIQIFVTDVVANEFLASTFQSFFFSPTKALHLNVNITFLTLTLMAFLFAMMN